VPLMTASGAGAARQQSLGTVVFGGMLASTLLAIPFVPVFYIVMDGVSERWFGKAEPAKAPTVNEKSETAIPVSRAAD
jgi:hypothetical protein